ncbi:IMPACT family protein [Oryzifoliimicrobium ureilyticus]|uniref:IMPACT family protein n=1 Tax=Oryzifoliimicrobium ureilyticus TaxID=3113724 RepID=UPI003075F98D
MFTLTNLCTAHQDIKRSRFIAAAGPVADEAAAKQFIQRHAVPEANHNCWAWSIGQNYRFSDDGEPSGTAGRPILQAIQGADLDMVAVLVTRWFGGTLLGSGGLMRAYGGTASLCLQAGEAKELVAETEVAIDAPFSTIALLKARLLAIHGVRMKSERFTATGAHLDFIVPEAELTDLMKMANDVTSGKAVIAPRQKP